MSSPTPSPVTMVATETKRQPGKHYRAAHKAATPTATKSTDQSGAPCHHPHRHLVTIVAAAPGGNLVATIEQRTQGGHIHGHPVH